MKLSDWARKEGVHYTTAYRWFRSGILPVPHKQMPTGTILIFDPELSESSRRVAIYGRVSSGGQKSDLDRQVARLTDYASKKNLIVAQVVTEIGSGLNGHRKKLIRLLRERNISAILVEHKDRMVRFGFDYLESALSHAGKSILVLDPKEMKDDLVQDMIDVLTSFCARLYGRRSAKNKAKKALQAIQK